MTTTILRETTFDKIDLPDKIYKYRTWKKPEHKRVLTHKEIFFAAPLDCDEQHECNLERDFDALTDEMIYKFCYNVATKSGLPENERKEHAEKMLKETCVRDKAHQEKTHSLFRETLNQNLSLFSASQYRNVFTLWEDFAGRQEGLCVGFSTRKMFQSGEIFGSGGPVDYYPTSNPPKIRPLTFSEDEKMEDMMKVIFSLPDKFVREKEYRLAKSKLENKQVKLSADAYEEVILGDKIGEKDKKEILELVKREFPKVRLFQARCNYDIQDYLFEEIK